MTEPLMADKGDYPKIRTGKGMAEYICPQCKNSELRAGRFVPVPEETRDYRGQEMRLPEICNKFWAADDYFPDGYCLGVMVWTPTQAANDLLGEHFVINIGQGEQKISTMTELRTIERDSLRRSANGEGAPHIFRGFSQNKSNRDVNTLAGSSFEKAKQVPVNRKTQSGQDITARATDKFEGS